MPDDWHFSFFFFSSRRRHTRSLRDWSSDVCSSDLSDRASVSSPASPSADSRRGSGGSPRSVHAWGSVIWPLTPPEQTNTVSAPRRFTCRTSSRCPLSGWNGWVTITKPEGSLDDAALCRLRGNRQRTLLRG